VCAQCAGSESGMECSGFLGGARVPCLLGSIQFRRLELYYQYQQGLTRLEQECGVVKSTCGRDKGVAVVGDSDDEKVCRSCRLRENQVVRTDSFVERDAGYSSVCSKGVVHESSELRCTSCVQGRSDLSNDQLLEPHCSDSVLGSQQCSGVSGGDLLGVAGGSDEGCESTQASEVKSEVSRVYSLVGEKKEVFEVGEKTLRNRATRKLRSERKKQRKASGSDWRLRGTRELNKTLEDKWKVENELATEKARRQLEVLRANSVEQEVKKYRTKINADTERNMVSIEKTHALLSSTGNIPGVFCGTVETVVSGEPGLVSGSISPNSSASMAEFRACQKSLLDSQSEIADLKRKMQLMSERFGFPMQHADYIDKRTWTDNEENDLILGDMYPDGYGMNTMFMPEGKFRPC